jgi:hypothetical protein
MKDGVRVKPLLARPEREKNFICWEKAQGA